jgi:hypothetical protein
MTIPTAVALFRGLRADRYIDACVVSRITGTIFNETTGQTEETVTEVYDGECLVRPAQASEVDFGEDRRQRVDYDLYLPFDAAELEEGDVVTTTSVHDPELGVLTVLRGFMDSYLTHQRYECEVLDDD